LKYTGHVVDVLAPVAVTAIDDDGASGTVIIRVAAPAAAPSTVQSAALPSPRRRLTWVAVWPAISISGLATTVVPRLAVWAEIVGAGTAPCVVVGVNCGWGRWATIVNVALVEPDDVAVIAIVRSVTPVRSISRTRSLTGAPPSTAIDTTCGGRPPLTSTTIVERSPSDTSPCVSLWRVKPCSAPSAP
jgi:hypothetical protein